MNIQNTNDTKIPQTTSNKSSVIFSAVAIAWEYYLCVFSSKEQKCIADCISKLLPSEYRLRLEPIKNDLFIESRYTELQDVLAKLNEKEDIRKQKGVYYTPTDVVHFITENSIKSLYKIPLEKNGYYDLPTTQKINFCLERKVLEPTCGAGEFLLEVTRIKINWMRNLLKNIDDSIVSRIIKTIYGNDINFESCFISKFRIFLEILHCFGCDIAAKIIDSLNENFTSIDFITSATDLKSKYDLVLGNPPYVEDSEYGEVPEKFGNVYCNVLKNSAKILADTGGVIGFIIPISYTATPRMKKIRKELFDHFPEQYIWCYSDRPDCLFTSVHQKLSILIGASKRNAKICTSHYQYWYKNERDRLFANQPLVTNQFMTEDFVPKLGNLIEIGIYKKVTKRPLACKISDLFCHDAASDLFVQDKVVFYLNMRATFWIKAFLSPHSSGEYKAISCCDLQTAAYLFCIFNSSLFWWYWTCTSDCWHITNKELNNFYVPMKSDFAAFVSAANVLEQKLEETKKYVGTRQTDYEYKHRDCLDEIHVIDDLLAQCFNLTDEENQYIKQFAIKYRTGGGEK